MLHSRSASPLLSGRSDPQETVEGSQFRRLVPIYSRGKLCVALSGTDLVTSASAVALSLGKVCVGFGLVGPSGSFGFFSGSVKALLVFLMLVGRLELFTMLILLSPSFWREA